MPAAISIEHLSKSYRLGAIGGSTVAADLSRWWAKLRGQPDPFLKVGQEHQARRIGELFWALNDVSFEVRQGEALGIVGRNGAGKSTLLKILSQVTGPTSGQIRIRGRVASLLEVGTGFHPELTGRENIFLNGAILGMTRVEIKSRFDEIVAFSECEEFIDTPVKRYSSGMYVRLAFAVAAHLEPEILVVDEVLAVGDAQFQKKCLGKMGEASHDGRTVLFVSHNMVAVQSLCHHAVLLREGRLEAAGTAASIVGDYLREAFRRTDTLEWSTPYDAPGTSALRVKAVQIAPSGGGVGGLIGMDSEVEVRTVFWVLEPGRQLHLTYHLVNDEGTTVLTSGSPSATRQVGLHCLSFTLPANLLNSGGYSLKLLIVENENRVIYHHNAIGSFEVVDSAQRGIACLGREPGVVQPHLTWTESNDAAWMRESEAACKQTNGKR